MCGGFVSWIWFPRQFLRKKTRTGGGAPLFALVPPGGEILGPRTLLGM
jgi:hypothetical protein